MQENEEVAIAVARRILNTGNSETGSAGCPQLLTDLAEMVRQCMRGEKLLGEIASPSACTAAQVRVYSSAGR
jgi:hypothetical protein